MNLTKTIFLAKYEAALIASPHPWTRDETAREKFMDAVRRTLAGKGTWHWDDALSVAIWQAHGGKGKPTRKALQALPD